MLVNSLDFEVDADGADKRRRERVVRVAEEKRRFADAAVADDEQFEHVVEVLVRRVRLPTTVTRHLRKQHLSDDTRISMQEGHCVRHDVRHGVRHGVRHDVRHEIWQKSQKLYTNMINWKSKVTKYAAA